MFGTQRGEDGYRLLREGVGGKYDQNTLDKILN